MRTDAQKRGFWPGVMLMLTLGLATFGYWQHIPATEVVTYLVVIATGLMTLFGVYRKMVFGQDGPAASVLAVGRMKRLGIEAAVTSWLFVNGILANPAPSEWDVQWAAWINRDGLGIGTYCYYWTGLLALWGRQDAIKRCASAIQAMAGRKVIVCHSFGSVVTLQALLMLLDAYRGDPVNNAKPWVDQLHILAGAAPSDCAESGLNDLADADCLGAVYLYTSTGDWVLRFLAPWAAVSGIGQLGYTGAVSPGAALGKILTAVAHDDYGHEDYVYDRSATKAGQTAAEIRREILAAAVLPAALLPSAPTPFAWASKPGEVG